MLNAITSISLSRNVSLITVNDVPSGSSLFSDLFFSIAKSGINVDMISQTPPRGGNIRLSFTINDASMTNALKIIGSFKAMYPGITTEVSSSNCKLSFFGEKMVSLPGVAASVLSFVKSACGELMVITTSTSDISVLVSDNTLDDVLRAIKKETGLTPIENE